MEVAPLLGVSRPAPGEELGDGGLEVDAVEPIEQRRVHLGDGVRRVDVDGTEDPALRVQLPAVELVVERHLEEGLHDLDGAPVELIEEQEARLQARLLDPIGRVETRRLAVGAGEADDVALRQLTCSPVDDRELPQRGVVLEDEGPNLAGHSALAHAVVGAEQHGRLCGQLGCDLLEGRDRHRCLGHECSLAAVVPLYLGTGGPFTNLLCASAASEGSSFASSSYTRHWPLRIR